MAARALRGRCVLITSGPTREHLDAIRFLTNGSTGRMGRALAEESRRQGAEVYLVEGPTGLGPPPKGVVHVPVVSTSDLLRAARPWARKAQIVLLAAAPCDWRPRRRRAGKPSRHGGLSVALVPTVDVAAALARGKGGRLHVGFALEVGGGERRARRKMSAKGLDAIVLNGPQNFGSGGGAVSWIEPGRPPSPLPSRSKAVLARSILRQVVRLLAKRRAP